MRSKFILVSVVVAVFGGIIFQNAQADMLAQLTATPARISLSTPTPPATLPFVTNTPTRTPTPIGLVVLEAITEANVRAEPDPESERLGTIRSGEIYPVLGRYFRWLQFQYDPSPNGKGWVFDELVTVTGDINTITDLSVQDVPTIDPALLGATQTLQAVTLTPGGILTATANAAVLFAPVPGENVVSGGGVEQSGGGVLPTYTYPPNVFTPGGNGSAEILPTTSPDDLTGETTDGVAPIVPILALGGLGLLGLVVSSLRK